MMMDRKKEELIFARHLEELARSAYYKGICTYTDFLSLNEISIFHSVRKELSPVPYSMYGGLSGAERVRICFHGDREEGSKELPAEDFRAEYPISCVKIKPSNAKFAERLSHRDYLGAILNLGIDRKTTGDILMKEDTAYLYCDILIAPFLCENLTKIRHTTVLATLLEDFHTEEECQEHDFETIQISVASLRLDNLVSAAFHASRSSLSGLIPAGKVFVNGREVLQNSYVVKPDDVISVRGYGKFVFRGQGSLTKKGRINVTLEKYV